MSFSIDAGISVVQSRTTLLDTECMRLRTLAREKSLYGLTTDEEKERNVIISKLNVECMKLFGESFNVLCGAYRG